MRLISATTDFLISGRPYPGFPILLWDNMEGCRPVNEFFRFYLLRGAIGSKKSWSNTARALYDYFSFLQAHNLSWDDVSRGEQKTLVAAYRDYCLEEYDLARATVRNRLVYICKFYEFAMHQQWIQALPFSYDIRRMSVDGRFLAHVSASGGVVATPNVMPRAHKGLPKFLSPAQVKQLLQSAENPHHHMIIRLALGTGLRKEELATFPLAYVFNPDRPYRHERNVRVSLDPRDGHGMRTKGSKARDIYVSRQLMKDLHHYAVHQRGLRSALSSHEHSPLFLNQSGEPFGSDGRLPETHTLHKSRLVFDLNAVFAFTHKPHEPLCLLLQFLPTAMFASVAIHRSERTHRTLNRRSYCVPQGIRKACVDSFRVLQCTRRPQLCKCDETA